MRLIWQRWSGKQRLMAVTTVVLAALLTVQYSGVSAAGLPLPATIRDLEQERAELQERVRTLRMKRDRESRVLTELNALAAPFWEVERTRPEALVTAEFQRLARANQVQIALVSNAQTREYLGLEHVREVELGFQINGTMKEISRLLGPLETARPAFYWSQCTIRPDNPRTPKTIRLKAKVRALVLSAEATRLLAGRSRAGREGS